MKNLKALANKREIHDYVYTLFKTDLFKRSYLQKGVIYDVVDQFAWLPRLFCEESNDYLERAHFSTWWNVLVHRGDYTNPVINDLYWIHEFYHAAHMPYIPGIGRAAFTEKMQRNELEASVFSEITIYFDLPELRALSFDHEIYADRFLENADMQNLWTANRSVAIETMRSIRRDVMVSKAEHTMDLTERWIRRFAEQNDAYSITWADRYGEVEERMGLLQSSIGSGVDRESVLASHRLWIEREAARDAKGDNIPFRQEAELFSPFYWANKAKFQKAMETKA